MARAGIPSTRANAPRERAVLMRSSGCGASPRPKAFRAKIHRTKNSEMELSTIFDIGTVDFSIKLEGHDSHHDVSHHSHGHPHHGHHHHNHLQNIDTVCIEQPGELDGLKVSIWFRSVIGEFGDKILRMKSI